MSVIKLIGDFSIREHAPVEVNDIVDYVAKIGATDEIYFFDANIKTSVLKGIIKQWEYPLSDAPDAPVRRVAEIYTASSLPPDEKRLIECKELLHVMEPEHFRVNTYKAVDDLVKKIILPPELIDPFSDGVHANSDRAAMYHALAVLFPLAVRDLFMPPFKDDKIDLAYIADIVHLPLYYVNMVMSDHWAIIHGMMLRRRQPDRVATLNGDDSPIEVHSVPLGDDPYTYAKRMNERLERNGSPVVPAFAIESHGEKRKVSAGELAAYEPRNGLKPG